MSLDYIINYCFSLNVSVLIEEYYCLVVCFPGKIQLHALNSHQHGELSYKAVIFPGSYNFAL